MSSSLETRILNLVVEQLRVKREKVTLDSTLESLGVDSLEAVDLIMAIESEFSVHIPDEKSPSLDTARKMIAYLEAHGGGN